MKRMTSIKSSIFVLFSNNLLRFHFLGLVSSRFEALYGIISHIATTGTLARQALSSNKKLLSETLAKLSERKLTLRHEVKHDNCWIFGLFLILVCLCAFVCREANPTSPQKSAVELNKVSSNLIRLTHIDFHLYCQKYVNENKRRHFRNIFLVSLKVHCQCCCVRTLVSHLVEFPYGAPHSMHKLGRKLDQL